MPIVEKISEILATVSDAIGIFVFPLVIILSAALLVFSRYSYRCFRIVLPISGIVLGALVGASVTDILVKTFAIEVNSPVELKYIVGIIIAAALGFFCFKFHRFAVLLSGACLGYIVVGRAVKDFLLLFPFVQLVASGAEPALIATVAVIVCLICMLGPAYLVNRFFKPVYLFATSICGAVLALVVPTVLMFTNPAIVGTAALVAAIIGLAAGAVCYGIQSYETMYY